MDSEEAFTAKTTKYSRVRGPTWTDDEVHKLFLAWSQPKIYNGFLNEKKKKEVFLQLSQELNKYSVTRSWEECRAKIKNLKGDYKKARENDNPQGFRYFELMDKMMTTAPAEDNSVPTTPLHGVPHQPVEIEFEIMSDCEMDFQEVKGGALPIQISPSGSIIIPQVRYSSGGDAESSVLEGELHIETEDPEQCIHHHPSLVQSQGDSLTASHLVGNTESPLIVLASGSAVSHGTGIVVGEASTAEECSASSSKLRYQGYSTAGKRTGKTSHDISQKRRKLHSLSEKMADTVNRILTQTTNSLIEEIKESEERFMISEEKRRLEDQKREEQMLQNLITAIRYPNRGEHPPNKIETEQDTECGQTMLEMIHAAEDPCAMTFDLLASRITTILTDQHKETEQMIQQWEFKMQGLEMKHTENLFKMILSAVRSHNDSSSSQ